MSQKINFFDTRLDSRIIPSVNPDTINNQRVLQNQAAKQQLRDDTVLAEYVRPNRASKSLNNSLPSAKFNLVNSTPIPADKLNDGYYTTIKHGVQSQAKYVIERTILINSILKGGDWITAEYYLGRPLTAEEKTNRSISGYRDTSGEERIVKANELIKNKNYTKAELLLGRNLTLQEKIDGKLEDGYKLPSYNHYWRPPNGYGVPPLGPQQNFPQIVPNINNNQQIDDYEDNNIAMPSGRWVRGRVPYSKQLSNNVDNKNDNKDDDHDDDDDNDDYKNYYDFNEEPTNGAVLTPEYIAEQERLSELEKLNNTNKVSKWTRIKTALNSGANNIAGLINYAFPPEREEQKVKRLEREEEKKAASEARRQAVWESRIKSQEEFDQRYPSLNIVPTALDPNFYYKNLSEQNKILHSFKKIRRNEKDENVILNKKIQEIKQNRKETRKSLNNINKVNNSLYPNLDDEEVSKPINIPKVYPTALSGFTQREIELINKYNTSKSENPLGDALVADYKNKYISKQISNNNNSNNNINNNDDEEKIILPLRRGINNNNNSRSLPLIVQNNNNNIEELKSRPLPSIPTQRRGSRPRNDINYLEEKHNGNDSASSGHVRAGGYKRKRNRSRSRKARFHGRGLKSVNLDNYDLDDYDLDEEEPEQEEEIKNDHPFGKKVISSLKKNKLGRYQVLRNDQPFGIFFIDIDKLQHENILSLIRQTTRTKINGYPNQSVSDAMKLALLQLMQDVYPDFNSLSANEQLVLKDLIKRSKLNISRIKQTEVKQETSTKSTKPIKSKVQHQLELWLGAIRSGVSSKELKMKIRTLLKQMYKDKLITKEKILQISKAFKLH